MKHPWVRTGLKSAAWFKLRMPPCQILHSSRYFGVLKIFKTNSVFFCLKARGEQSIVSVDLLILLKSFYMTVLRDPDALPFRPNYRPLNEILDIVGDELFVLSKLGEAKGFVDILTSHALWRVTLVSLKNIPYTFFSEQTGTNTFRHAVSVHRSYLRVGIICMATLVRNVVFAMHFTAAAIVTLGQVQTINDLFRRKWIHVGLSLGSVVASLVGTIVPKLGQFVNLGVGAFAAAAVIYTSQSDSINTIKGIYARNCERFYEAGRALAQNNDAIFNREIQPILGYIDQNLEAVQTYSDLITFGEGLSGQIRSEIAGMLVGWMGGAEAPEGATV